LEEGTGAGLAGTEACKLKEGEAGPEWDCGQESTCQEPFAKEKLRVTVK
jgi:hypothetical protein